MASVMQIWDKVTEEIEKKVSALTFDLWIKTLEPICIYKNRLVLYVTTEANYNIILKRFYKIIKEATISVFPTLVDVELILEDQLEVFNKYRTKMQDAPVSNQSAIEDVDVVSFVEHYTFDNFVVGDSNKFAAAASLAVAEKPGSKYNPLFLYGTVGLGKTHLMHAIGNYYKQYKSSLKVVYVSAERFSNDLLDAIKDSSVNKDARKEFRNKYRNVDCLMIDDVQFIAKLAITQEEIFHAFNDLYLEGKQIILSSDRPPKEINPLESRLRTRFESGLVADIASPDLELRIAILQNACKKDCINIKKEILQIVAERVMDNVRDLLGLLNRVVSFATLTGRDYNDVEVVLGALKDYTNDEKEIITQEKIVDSVCNYYNVSKKDIVGKKKNKEIVVPRQVCIYLITEFLALPLSTIGEYFGGRDHTTIIHARDKISAQIKENVNIEKQVKDIKAQVLNK
ncbi:MAG: chromosomal replication initiator protein DnaA [Clostridia bacterium]|nr:chromosomal replication initiator protein DnaA [Clostridia bacterium]